MASIPHSIMYSFATPLRKSNQTHTHFLEPKWDKKKSKFYFKEFWGNDMGLLLWFQLILTKLCINVTSMDKYRFNFEVIIIITIIFPVTEPYRQYLQLPHQPLCGWGSQHAGAWCLGYWLGWLSLPWYGQ